MEDHHDQRLRDTQFQGLHARAATSASARAQRERPDFTNQPRPYLLGRRWVLRVLWELREEPAETFRDLQMRCGNISSSVLNQRLRELREAGILERSDPIAVRKQADQLALPIAACNESLLKSMASAELLDADI